MNAVLEPEIEPQTADESLNIQASTAELTDTDLDALEAKFAVLEARALELWKRDQDSALELGKALIAVRDALKDNHGAFTMWYRQHDLEENRVHYCIRKVEGKIAQPKKQASETIDIPDADFVLNKHNLAVAKFAPKDDGKYVTACVHVDSNGTTATDGHCLIQVSLPPGQPEIRKHNEGDCCRELFLRAARTLDAGKKEAPTGAEDRCWVSLGKEANVIATHDTAIQYAKPETTFPNYEKVIPKSEPVHEIFLGESQLSNLIELLTTAREFNPGGQIRIALRSKGRFPDLQIDCEPNWQKQRLLALLMSTTPYGYWEPKPTSEPAHPPETEVKALPPDVVTPPNDCELKEEL